MALSRNRRLELRRGRRGPTPRSNGLIAGGGEDKIGAWEENSSNLGMSVRLLPDVTISKDDTDIGVVATQLRRKFEL